MQSKKKGQLGKIMLGWTVGEEAICDKNFVCRIESCYAESESALLSVDKEYFKLIQEESRVHNLLKDSHMLEAVFRRNFFIKKHQRNPGGVKKTYFKHSWDFH